MKTLWGNQIDFNFYPALQGFYVLNIFTLPISGMAGYLIYKKTPAEMSQYRYFLLNIWFWTALSDFALTIVLQIQLFFPLFGGASCSLFVNYFFPMLPDNGYFAWVFTVWVLVNASISLLCGFIYRLWALDSETWLRRDKSYLYNFCAGIHVIKSSFETWECIMAYTPRDKMATFILERYPQYSSILTIPNFLLLEPALNPWNGYLFGTLITGEFAIFGTMIYIFGRISKILQDRRGCMSTRTYQQHRMLTISLILQSVLPIVVFYVPITAGMAYLLVDRGENGYIQGMAHGCLILLCLHTNINIIAMLCLIRPYRVEVLRWWAKMPWIGKNYNAATRTTTKVISTSRIYRPRGSMSQTSIIPEIRVELA
ncbi:unnamed protein product, partial [Mesorhabditis spiculigera]